MPGLELFGSSASAAAPASTVVELPSPTSSFQSFEMDQDETPRNPNVYYNPRLDPKNYLEGPLSLDAATRLRQMLARPGIVVSTKTLLRDLLAGLTRSLRLRLEFATASVLVVH